ncbi:MAG: DUF5685 family protein [Oscillibacter sp.]
MFGYIIPPDLPQEEMERFRRAYCGLCHTLGTRYGPAARFILNYDFTYLAILLSDTAEGETACARCLASPCKKRRFQAGTPALELAADESVILAYWQLRDGIADHGFWKGLKYRFLAKLLEGAYRKASRLRPGFDEITRRQLQLLSTLEAEHCASLDRVADTFAALLAGAAEEVDDPIRRRVLRQLLYHMGRWIYLVDAADDLEGDIASGNYNPLTGRFSLPDGKLEGAERQEFSQTLDHSVRLMATAFELWDFGCWTTILESTVYTGFFRVGKAVLDGTFKTSFRGERNRKRKNVEENDT